jgi:hypothetical protein
VARWQLCASLADGRMAWRWRLQCLSRTFQFGSFQCSLEPQRRNGDPTQLQRVRATHRVAFPLGLETHLGIPLKRNPFLPQHKYCAFGGIKNQHFGYLQ